MLHKDTLEFLKELKNNNNREWFADHKDWYERAKTDFEKLVQLVIDTFPNIDPEMGMLDAKKCIFRIYRDIRFSPDKTPYKTHFGAGFRVQGLQKSSGYYLHIDPDESFVSCGHYMLDATQLKKVRKGISADYEYFKSLLDEPHFRKEIGNLYRDNDTLKNVPKGFEPNDPAAEYLKLKKFYVFRDIPNNILTKDSLTDFISSSYKTMQPLSRFFNDVLLEETDQ